MLSHGWQKKVSFEGLLNDWQPGQYVRWPYRFSSDSFPAHALDDHVMIGGHYFDLIDTCFKLTPISGGTQPSISASYRVSAPFNFYAERMVEILLGNMLNTAKGFLNSAMSRLKVHANEFLHEFYCIFNANAVIAGV